MRVSYVHSFHERAKVRAFLELETAAHNSDNESGGEGTKGQKNTRIIIQTWESCELGCY